MKDSELQHQFKQLERFVCMAYSSNGPTILSSLRWEMFRSRNLEGELLPPTRATLYPHIQRTNYVCMRDKSYVSSKPNLPKLEENGWEFIKDNSYEPIRCVAPPAPKVVLELVKCGSKKTAARTVHVLKTNYPALLFANAMLGDVTAVLVSTKGKTKMVKKKRRITVSLLIYCQLNSVHFIISVQIVLYIFILIQLIS